MGLTSVLTGSLWLLWGQKQERRYFKSPGEREQGSPGHVVMMGMRSEVNSECILEVEMAEFLQRTDVGGGLERRQGQGPTGSQASGNSAGFCYPFTHSCIPFFFLYFWHGGSRGEKEKFTATLIVRVKLDTSCNNGVINKLPMLSCAMSEQVPREFPVRKETLLGL